MSITDYFQRKDELPDPKGPVSNSIPSREIEMANAEVEKVLTAQSNHGKESGKYTR